MPVGRRTKGIPQEAGYQAYVPSPEALIYRRAANGEMVGYTAAEYGVRKDDGGGEYKPYNSSGGLLFLSILISIFAAVVFVAATYLIVTRQWEELAGSWFAIPITAFPLVAGWSYYVKERRAERLRRERGLPTPVE